MAELASTAQDPSRDFIRATPRSPVLGYLSDLARASYSPERTQQMQGVAQFFGAPAISQTLNRMAYGEPLTTGAGGIGGTSKLRPEVTESAMFVMDFLPTSGVAKGAALAAPMIGGMFVGKGARTWDALAAAKAKMMADIGADPRTIWKETGTWKGPDGAWRQEIPDNAAKFNMDSDILNQIDANKQRISEIKGIKRDSLASEKLQSDFFPKDLSRARTSLQGESNKLQADLTSNFGLESGIGQRAEFRYSHPGLYEAYPDMKSGVVVRTGGGKGGDTFGSQYKGGIDINHPSMYEFKTNPKTGYTGYAETPVKAKSTAAHEFQHNIQDAEGWARGGSPDDFAGLQFNAQQESQQIQRALSIQDLAKRNGVDIDAAAKMYQKEMANPMTGEVGPIDGPTMDFARKHKTKDLKGYLKESERRANTSSMQQYRSLAGEAEARATQSRILLDATQRRALFPEDSFDVPINELIIRGAGD